MLRSRAERRGVTKHVAANRTEAGRNKVHFV